MAKRKNSTAYVRLDGNNQPIPGTLIFRQKKPYGKFAKMLDPAGDLCCGNPRNSCGARYSQDAMSYSNPNTTNTYFNPIASDADSNCFIYTMGEAGNFDQNNAYLPVVQKTDSAKNVIWTKRLELFEDAPSQPYISGLRVDGNGDVIVIYDIALVKLSGVDGSLLWSQQYSSWNYPEGEDTFIDYITNIAFDSNNNIFVGGSATYILNPDPLTNARAGFIMKLDTVDGSVTTATRIDVTTKNAYVQFSQEVMDIQVAYDDTVRVIYNYRDVWFVDPNYYDYANVTITSLANDLATVLWSKQLDYPYTGYYYYLYSSSFIVDASGNTFCNISSAGGDTAGKFPAFKIDESGNLVWVRTYLTSGYNLTDDAYVGDISSVTAEGDFIVSTTYGYVTPVTNNNARTIRKISGVDGSTLFNYWITNTVTGMNFWWNYTPRAANFVHGDTLYMCSYPSGPIYTFGYSQTFPVDQAIPNGTYGDYIVGKFNITDQIETVSLESVSMSLNTFTPELVTFTVVPTDDTYLVHNITNIP